MEAAARPQPRPPAVTMELDVYGTLGLVRLVTSIAN